MKHPKVRWRTLDGMNGKEMWNSCEVCYKDALRNCGNRRAVDVQIDNVERHHNQHGNYILKSDGLYVRRKK